MAGKKYYTLTRLAESDLYEARLWSLSRWGRALTQQYFSDLHEAAEYASMNHRSLGKRDDLTGDTGLFVHPVREHYLVYLPVDDQHIVIVAVIRQSRDVPDILAKADFMIRREVSEIIGKINNGEIKFL